MESIPSQLSTGRDVCSSPNSKQELQPYSSSSSLKPNQVSETVLYGVPIVSLVIDGQERLCLAQISNTLLKHYSYNEIHNRRVALGITCVQCTPVQLEILRRAGAMPISSRRCGMITKREAERLCKSFLGAHNPPKLPENFAFDVSHECSWGSRGSFIPARYNSSRAKCIKCTYCNMYFSPNKFIFHSHRTPESKYTQPDAANFNSWRRHLKLTDKSLSDDICHAWEDVKAMFNGGNRKRALPGNGSEMSSPLKPPASGNITQTASPDIPHKTLRCDDDRGNLNLTSSVRNYPVIPVPSKSFGMLQKIPPPIFPHPYSFPAFGLCQKKDDGVGEQNRTNVPGVFWPGAKDGIYPSFPMFWPTAGSLALSSYQPAQLKSHTELLGGRQTETDMSESERGGNTPRDSLFDSERCSSSQSLRNDEDKSGDEARSSEGQPRTPRKLSYISAFKPVVKDAESIAKLYGNRDAYSGAHPGHLSPDFVSESSSYRSASPCVDSGEEPDVDVETHRIPEDEESIQLSVDDRQSPVRENSPTPQPDDDHIATFSDGSSPDQKQNKQVAKKSDAIAYEVYSHEKEGASLQSTLPCSASKPPRCAPETNDSHISNNSPTDDECESQKSCSDHISVSKENPSDATLRNTDNRFNFEKDIENMAKEELQKQLLEQVELRKKLEREFQSLKDNFQDQMKRELSYREEMVQQLQIVRAHDALHHFSCKMLTPRHCTGTCTFKPPLLPP